MKALAFLALGFALWVVIIALSLGLGFLLTYTPSGA